jgi:hypothetical protein
MDKILHNYKNDTIEEYRVLIERSLEVAEGWKKCSDSNDYYYREAIKRENWYRKKYIRSKNNNYNIFKLNIHLSLSLFANIILYFLMPDKYLSYISFNIFNFLGCVYIYYKPKKHFIKRKILLLKRKFKKRIKWKK